MVVPIIDDQNTTMMVPTAPPLTERTAIENGNGGDYVEFLVIHNNNSQVVLGDRRAIFESRSELSKLNTSQCPIRKIDGNYVVNGIDKDDFELFIRYLETKFIKFRNVKHTLNILELATRFVCPDLVIQCVKDLDSNLSINNVIEVFRALWYYSSITPPPKKTFETKSKKKSKTPTQIIPITPEQYIAALLHNCLQLIDMEADFILQQPEIINFRFEELEMIVKRNGLQIKTEMTLFEVLAKWSLRECERKGMEINLENRRRVLGGMCYSPRYLIMLSSEFEQTCNRVELLDYAEINLIREEFKGKKLTNLTEEQKTMLTNFKRHRPPYATLPIYLSQRSDSKNYPKKMRHFERDKNEDKKNKYKLMIVKKCLKMKPRKAVI